MRVTIQFWKHEPKDLADANTLAHVNDADFFVHGIGVYRMTLEGYPQMVTHRDNFAAFIEDVINGRRS